jgi:DNA-binding NtrC family response regulator
MGDASRRVLAEVERRKIGQALKEAAGNRGRAAEMLQVSYKMFMTKLKEYGLDA